VKIRKYLFATITVSLCTSVLGTENFYSDIIRLDNCAQKIHQNYVDSLHSQKLIDAAIGGMLTLLDNNSVYFSNDESAISVPDSSDSVASSAVHYFTGMMNGNIAYIWFDHVTGKISTEIEKFLVKKRTSPFGAVILDLRECKGGVLNECISIAGMFLHKGGVIVSTRGRVRGQNNEFKSRSKPIVSDSIPVIVLISEQTASGAEIIAAALQYHERAILVGDTTAAAGRVGSIIPLDKTHVLKLTTSFLFSPSGKCIDRSGFDKNAMSKTFGQREIAAVPGVVPDVESVSIKCRSIIRALKELKYFNSFIKNVNSMGITSDSKVVFEKFRDFVVERSEIAYNADSSYQLFAPSVLMNRIAEYDKNLSDQINVTLLHVQRTFLLEQIDNNRQDIENELNNYLWRSENCKTASEAVVAPVSDSCLQKSLSLLRSKKEIWKMLRRD
jgi:carboxyl-terminal processing protease